jgi:membrane protein DedA with SNARE-associated domain
MTALLPSVNHAGLLLVALLVFLTELGIPTGIPNEVFLLLVGSTAVHSFPGLAGAIALVAAADLLGTSCLFFLARAGGGRLATWLLHGGEGERVLRRWRGRVGRSARRDVALVVGGRLVPLARTPFTLAMGLLRLRPRYFLLGAVPGALVWAGWPLTVGYVLGNRVDAVVGPLERYGRVGAVVLPLVVALAVVAVLGRWVWGRRHRAGEASKRRARC